MRVFLVGSAGPLSLLPLQYLLRSSHTVCGIGVDEGTISDRQPGQDTLMLQQAGSLASQARVDGLPVIDLARPVADVIGEVQALYPDIILVSCYARRLVEALLGLAPMGAVNIHPSPLPAFRGPSPVFWQFHHGVDEFGLSMHRMTNELDAGPVLVRRSVSMPDGISMLRANARLAESLPDLLEEALVMIDNEKPGTPQDPKQASYQGFPTASAFRVSTRWTARRVFNFMRATAYLGQVYPCEVDGRMLRLQHALDWSKSGHAEDRRSNRPDTLWLDCVKGSVLVSYYQ